MSTADWRKIPCPKCNRKGLHHPDHPHAFGYKNLDVIECRFCHRTFNSDKLEAYLAKKEATPCQP